MKYPVLLAAALSAGLSFGERAGELKISADRIAADNVTGALAASGHVHAVAGPVKLVSDRIGRDAEGVYTFSDPTSVTTCTNDWDDLHWSVTGAVTYRNRDALVLRDIWVRLWDVPVLWVPFWYYPIDTDYGWRVMPGYTRRWGAYLMTKYVYDIYGSDSGRIGFRGATRLDFREKNGVALGQSVRWNLGDFGTGKFKVYYAWDDDHDHYRRHLTSRRWNYQNWESKVPHERYGLELTHRCEVTERDLVWLQGRYVSDTRFDHDFLRDGAFLLANDMARETTSLLAWEHRENPFALGLSAEGPLNDFYPGVAKLPEFRLDVNPQPVFGLPVNYESETRLGYYDRDYGKIGWEGTALPFRYNPGPWANYNAFRLDTYHRLTAPFKVADVLSVVPRVGYRGTYWSESGETVPDGDSRAHTTGDDVYRSIIEGGVTFAARGTADFDGGWRHVLEPYLDVLVQEADYSGLGRDARPYVFDNADASSDWLDQFAGRSRNLPYSYHGITPGLRNALRKTDDAGESRTVLDFDVYCAVQFNDTDYTEGPRTTRLVRNPEKPNYGKHDGKAVPGARIMWRPTKDTSLSARAEYDTDENALAYGHLELRHAVSDGFSWYGRYIGRDHRWWDYAPAAYDPDEMKRDDFNWARYQFAEVGFEHELCDAVAWSPFVRWDIRDNELDEVGAWIDFRTDCLGFRFICSFDENYERVDRSTTDCDFSCGFFIYLRALGPVNGNPLKAD